MVQNFADNVESTGRPWSARSEETYFYASPGKNSANYLERNPSEAF